MFLLIINDLTNLGVIKLLIRILILNFLVLYFKRSKDFKMAEDIFHLQILDKEQLVIILNVERKLFIKLF